MFKSIVAQIIVVLLLFTVGCTKKRPSIESQGSNLANLEGIAGLNNRECTITTEGGENQERKIQVTSNETKILGTAVQFPLVRNIIEEDCPLITLENSTTLDFKSIRDDSPVNGEKRPVKHRVKFVLELDYLVIYKIVNKTQLAHIEKSSALTKGEMFWVPVGGFKVSGFYNIEKSRNSDNRETNVDIKVSVPRESAMNSNGSFNAQYIQVDKKRLKTFVNADRKDIVPKSYFSGEWYYSSTVIENSQGHGINIGWSNSRAHNGHDWVDTSIVKFTDDKDYLYAVSTVIDPEAKLDNKFSMPIVFKMKADHIDYRRKTEDGVVSLKEEVVDILDSKKKFYQVEYDSLSTTGDLFSGLFKRFKDIISKNDTRSNVVSVEYSENYFSIILESARDGKVKHSLMRRNIKDRDYSPKVAHLTDMNRFGYYFTKEVKVYDEYTSKYQDFDNLFKLSRFNPKNKIIKYYFSSQTPKEKWIRDIGKEAINLWNQALSLAGLDITLEMVYCEEENMGCKDVELGDIRYNIMNLIDIKFVNASFAGGFGPSINDPETGEVISATSNIYINKHNFYWKIRKYLNTKAGFTADFSNRLVQDTSYSQDKLMLGLIDQNAFIMNVDHEISYDNDGSPIGLRSTSDKHLWSPYRWTDDTQTRMTNDKFANDDGEYVLNNYLGLAQEINLSTVEVLERNNLMHFTESGSSYVSGAINLNDNASSVLTDKVRIFIENNCTETNNYIDGLSRPSDRVSSAEEVKIFKSCVQKLIQFDFLGIAVHEVGHNLGLRHNFRASVDKANVISVDQYDFNYLDIESFGFDYSSSSIMDYDNSSLDINPVPGWYDIAAIRFGYMNKVEMAGNAEDNRVGSGRFTVIPGDMTIAEFEAKENMSTKKYDYCTDHDGRRNKSDIYCGVGDSGTTATEIVTNYANTVLSLLESRTLRFNSPNTSSQLSIFGYLMQMKLFYDEWRNNVLTQTGMGAKYLEGYSEEAYSELIEKMLMDPIHGPRYKDLLQARNIYINLLLDLSFLPNKYCITSVIDVPGTKKLVELSYIRDILFTQNSEATVSNCEHKEVINYLKSEGLELLKNQNEIGYFLKGGRFSLSKATLPSVLSSGFGYDGEQRDFSGTMVLRAQAIDMLSTRLTRSFTNMGKEYFPSMLDEPDVRKTVKVLLMKRLTEGLHLKPGLLRPGAMMNQPRLFNQEDIDSRVGEMSILENGEEENNLSIYQNYQEEKNLLELFFSSFMYGLNVPNNLAETLDRKSEFSISVTLDKGIADAPGYKSFKLDKTTYIFTEPGENNYASQVIDMVDRINKLIKDENDPDTLKTIEDKNKLLSLLTDEVKQRVKTNILEAYSELTGLTGEQGNMYTLFRVYKKVKAAIELERSNFKENPEIRIYLDKFIGRYEGIVLFQINGFIEDLEIAGEEASTILEYTANLPEDFSSETNIFSELEANPKHEEYTEKLIIFLNDRLSLDAIYNMQPMFKTKELAIEHIDGVAAEIELEVSQLNQIKLFRDEKLAQKGILINVLLMSR